jgi:hypothetical protein
VIEGNATKRFVHLVHLSLTQLGVVRSRESVLDREKPRAAKAWTRSATISFQMAMNRLRAKSSARALFDGTMDEVKFACRLEPVVQN